jgi:predicted TIM-barrel fold metal-dependent hydrolase
VTEANPDWTVADLQPYAEHVFRAFGPERVMWGSDWPVVRLRCEYDSWRAAAEQLTAPRSPNPSGLDLRRNRVGVLPPWAIARTGRR